MKWNQNKISSTWKQVRDSDELQKNNDTGRSPYQNSR